MEIELKFTVPPSRFDEIAAALQTGDTERQHLLARYFDTDDGRLAARSVALRLRSENGRWVQTVKALTPDHVRRLEDNVDRDAPPDGGEPRPDPALHDGGAAGTALRAALGEAPPPLVERFRTDVERLVRREIADDGAVVELALDRGEVRAGDRSDAVSEFELELKSGAVKSLFDVAGRWAVDRGLALGTITKAERGGRLLADASPASPLTAAPPQVDRRGGTEPFVAAVLAICLKQILGNASELGGGGDEEGFVHQLRIGLRRLRTALRELDDFADGIDPSWEATFRRSFQALGAHRDAEAVLPTLRAEMRAAGLRYTPPDAAPQASAATPADIVADRDLQRALLGVMAFCEALTVPRPREPRAKKRLQRQVAKRLDRLHDALARDARRFSRLSADRQHRARKRLKRLRYLAEFAEPLFGPKRVRRYLKSWKAAQDALGEANDHHVGLSLMRADLLPGADRRQAIRWTLATLQTLVERCEKTLRQAVRKKTFWQA